MTASSDPAIRFAHISRRFGEITAVDDVSLDIADGDFFSILGPSGSGKTTCLRLVAGFDRPTSGSLLLHGMAAEGLPPFERDLNTVFQDYALFPHMTVAENVGFGLRIRRMPRAERALRVGQMLELVRLPGIGGRRPGELSGGQRQRVALARALAGRPRVLLLDEPLGALDLKLRQQMQGELKAIQRHLGITFVHVTHDQEEALGMSDRLAVLRDGRLEQVGAPVEVYEHPRTVFVADFLGGSNLLRGAAAAAIAGSPRPLSIRPEKIRIEPEALASPAGLCSATGTIREVIYQGVSTRCVVALDLGPLLAAVEQNHGGVLNEQLVRGRRVRAVWDPRHQRHVVESP